MSDDEAQALVPEGGGYWWWLETSHANNFPVVLHRVTSFEEDGTPHLLGTSKVPPGVLLGISAEKAKELADAALAEVITGYVRSGETIGPPKPWTAASLLRWLENDYSFSALFRVLNRLMDTGLVLRAEDGTLSVENVSRRLKQTRRRKPQ